jgi:hypothetical protein
MTAPTTSNNHTQFGILRPNCCLLGYGPFGVGLWLVTGGVFPTCVVVPTGGALSLFKISELRDVVLLVLCWELDCPWVTGGVSVGMPSEVRRSLFLDVLLLTLVTGVLCLLCNRRRASTSEIFRSWVVSRTVMPTCVFRFVGYRYLLSTRPVMLTHCPRQLLSGAT